MTSTEKAASELKVKERKAKKTWYGDGWRHHTTRGLLLPAIPH
jgi:hypothetical protein